jgi:hypothetical protein
MFSSVLSFDDYTPEGNATCHVIIGMTNNSGDRKERKVFLKVFLAALAFLAVNFAGLYGRESKSAFSAFLCVPCLRV